jgi:hypothetical protein
MCENSFDRSRMYACVELAEPLAIEGLSAATGDRRICRAEISASGLRHFRWRDRPSGVANRPVSIGPRGEVEAKLWTYVSDQQSKIVDNSKVFNEPSGLFDGCRG